jgi:hypothetical protein
MFYQQNKHESVDGKPKEKMTREKQNRKQERSASAKTITNADKRQHGTLQKLLDKIWHLHPQTGRLKLTLCLRP